MFHLRPRNLNQALGRLLAAVMVPLLLGTLGVLALQARQEHKLAQTRLAALAQTLMLATDAEFERGRAQLEVLAASPLIDAGDWKGMYRFASEVTRTMQGGVILLVGTDGRPVFNTSAPIGHVLPNLWTLADQNVDATWNGRALPLSSGNLSRRAIQTGRVQYSDLYYGVQTERPALAVSIPVKRGGRARYALVMSFSPMLVQERIQQSVTLSDVRTILVDRKGRVVASNTAASSSMGDKAIMLDTAPGSTAGFYRTVPRDGTRVVGAYAVSPRTGFTTRVSQPDVTTFLPSGLASLAWLVLLLAAVAASMMLASLFSRRLAQPLRELGEDVRAGRAPSGERRTGIAEIDLLAQALRDGADAERQRAQEQLLRTMAQNQEASLRQADRQKDEFLATLAHELRNPLAPIRTAAELIRRRAPADPVVERARDTIERQTLHLSRLVDDLLDVSRITLGRIHLRQETLDLGAVATAALESIGDAAAQAQVMVAQDIDGPAPFVRGDITRLTQCVVNVLNNAVKFTPAGGRVQLRVAHEGAKAIVEVRDTGVGITADNLQRIFELFVQERHSGHHGNSGLGIGLALTRRLVELHGGTITASSDGLARGSVFRIELPAVEAPVVEAPPPADAQAAPPPTGARLLVVDDNRDAAVTLGELLAMSGYEVALAHDGASALRQVVASPPAAVLLDIGLPDVDGYEVCRCIRSDESLAHQPLLVAVTGWGQPSDQAAANAAGFDAHMTKPVALEALLQLLEKRLRAA
ncbi:MAG: hybrid sensor histidine kinase/response regulator [Ramlibacter sp.]